MSRDLVRACAIGRAATLRRGPGPAGVRADGLFSPAGWDTPTWAQATCGGRVPTCRANACGGRPAATSVSRPASAHGLRKSGLAGSARTAARPPAPPGRARPGGVPAPPRPAGGPSPMGRPRRHGAAMALAEQGSWPEPTIRSVTDTVRYGRAEATGWDRLHPRLPPRGSWADPPDPLPIVEGTLIRLQVDPLPGQRQAKPIWLWSSHTGADTDDLTAEVIRCWQAYLRRFDLEHTIRLFKQILGWTTPKIRSPEAADRWTWLVVAAYTQLRLARPLAHDLRRPWERPLPPERLTPAWVRRGFRHLGAKTTQSASAPKPSHPGPGRPAGSKNRHHAIRYDVGKTVTRDAAMTENPQVK